MHFARCAFSFGRTVGSKLPVWNFRVLLRRIGHARLHFSVQFYAEMQWDLVQNCIGQLPIVYRKTRVVFCRSGAVADFTQDAGGKFQGAMSVR